MARITKILFAACAAFALFGAPAHALPTAGLVGHWTFDSQADSTGHWADLTLEGSGAIAGGELAVSGFGNGPYAATGWAHSDTYSGPTLTSKTLVSWVKLDDLDTTSGSALTLYDPNTDEFDAIVWAENQYRQWWPGSDYGRRSQDFSPGHEDNGGPNELRQLAISYVDNGDGSETITGCLDGTQLGQYTVYGHNKSFGEENAVQTVFGARHRDSGLGYAPIGSMNAHIDEAWIYDHAMSCGEATDTDMDGVANASDSCPHVSGAADTAGCPTVESYSPSASIAPVYTSAPLDSGQNYTVTLQGTYSPYEARQMVPVTGYAICGTPFAAPMFPTPGITNARPGRDPEFVTAYPLLARSCPAKDAAKLPRRQTMARFSLDGGGTWFTPVANGAPTAASSDHAYNYAVTGNGNTLKVKLDDTNYKDNSGRFTINIEPASAPAG